MHSQNPDKKVIENHRQNVPNRWVFLTIVVLGFLIYARVLKGEFVSDDYVTIVDNLAVRNLNNLGDIWRAFNTRFLVGLTFALNFSVGKFNVVGYHLVNILLHFCNAFLVYKLVRLTFETPVLKKDSRFPDSFPIAFFSALIFLCHPIQTQGVSFITQRAVDMGTLFYLSILLSYLKWRLTEKSIYYGTALLSLLLGIFSKEMIITAPITLMMYELFFFDNRAKTRNLIPFFLLTCLLPLIFLSDQSNSIWKLKNQVAQRGWNWWYFLTEINVLRTYLRLLFFPVHQTHEYDYALVKNFWELGNTFSIGLLGTIFVFACRQFQKNRLLSFAIFWFFLTTSVEAIVVSIVNRALIYEHWLYLPMVGFAVFVTVLFYRFFTNQAVFNRVMVGILVVLSLLSYQRNSVWQNEIAFWEDGKRKTPTLPNVYLGAGNAYQRRNFFHEAYSNYSQALQFYDHSEAGAAQLTQLAREFYARIYSNLGIVAFMLWRDKEALGDFRQAAQLDPTDGHIYNNLGVVFFEWGKYQETIDAFQKSIVWQGDYPEAYRYLGQAYAALGQSQIAKGYFEKAISLFRRYGEGQRVKELEKLLAAQERPLK